MTMVDLSGNVPFKIWKRKLHTMLVKMFLVVLIRIGLSKVSSLLIEI